MLAVAVGLMPTVRVNDILLFGFLLFSIHLSFNRCSGVLCQILLWKY